MDKTTLVCEKSLAGEIRVMSGRPRGERFHIENDKIERFISGRWMAVPKPPLPVFEVRQDT